MTGKLCLKYGQTSMDLPLPGSARYRILEPPGADAPGSEAEIIRQALETPLASPPLTELAGGKKSAAILVSGKTRITGIHKILPLVIEQLTSGGISRERIKIVFATGTHDQLTEAEVEAIIGGELAREITWSKHDCFDEKKLALVGQTSFGNAVFVNTTVLEADLKILTGRINYHYFAGFSGGRKAILPGVSGFPTICHNHRMVLSHMDNKNYSIGNGILANNPVHLDMLEAAAMVQPDFIINTILDRERRIVACCTGEMQQAHAQACKEVERYHLCEVGEKAGVIFSSPGGYPADINFMQSLKAIFNCAPALRENGTLVLLAQCSRGIHKNFLAWAAKRQLPNLRRYILENYNLAGHNSYLLKEFLQRARLILVSDLSREVVTKMGFDYARTGEEAVQLCDLRSASPAYIIPEGNNTFVRFKKSE